MVTAAIMPPIRAPTPVEQNPAATAIPTVIKAALMAKLKISIKRSTSSPAITLSRKLYKSNPNIIMEITRVNLPILLEALFKALAEVLAKDEANRSVPSIKSRKLATRLHNAFNAFIP